MKAAQILQRPARVLTTEQRQFYFDTGYLLLEDFITREELTALRQATAELVDRSRQVSLSDDVFDVEPDHSSDEPRLRRVTSPTNHHRAFQDFTFAGSVVDVAEDLLGPSVRVHHSKLNFKWARGGEEVKWHQDIQYWPHTDFSPLTIGVYLEDVDDEMGPMGVVPGSHRGELFDLYDDAGRWTGSIREEDIERAHPQNVVYLQGPAGSVTVHNCCTVHGSRPNSSPRCRPLLLQTYAGGDSFPLLGVGTNGAPGKFTNAYVRGERTRWMEVAGRQVPVAPDWSGGGYVSIFEVQQR